MEISVMSDAGLPVLIGTSVPLTFNRLEGVYW